MSVVLGLLPTKGIPLPFISAGGSSPRLHAACRGADPERLPACGLNGAHLPHRGGRHGGPPLPRHRGGRRAAPPRPGDARRLRGHAAGPGVAARPPGRLCAGAAAHPAPQRRRAAARLLQGLLAAAARALRCGRSRSCGACARTAVLGVGGYAGGPVVARGRAPGSAHGDPRAQREARLHEPRAAALRATRPPAPTRRRAPATERRACSPATRCAAASPRCPRKPHGRRRLAARLRRQPGLARPQPAPWSTRCRTCPAPDRLRIVHQTGRRDARRGGRGLRRRRAATAEVTRLPRRHGAPLRRGRPRGRAQRRHHLRRAARRRARPAVLVPFARRGRRPPAHERPGPGGRGAPR